MCVANPKTERPRDHQKWWQIGRKVKLFRKSEDGTAAVEFAIVAIPFFLFVGAIFELSIHFFVNSIMDHAIGSVAREIRTNQITPNTHTEAQFRGHICGRPEMFLFDCDNLIIDVQEVANFDDPGVPRNPDGSVNPSGMGFNPGDLGSRSINILRVYYEWPTVMAFANFSNDPMWARGNRIIMSSEAFKLEPQ